MSVGGPNALAPPQKIIRRTVRQSQEFIFLSAIECLFLDKRVYRYYLLD